MCYSGITNNLRRVKMKINAQIIISDGVMQSQSDGSGNVIQNPTLLIQLPFMPSAASMTLSVIIATFGDEVLKNFSIATQIIHEESKDVVFSIPSSNIGPFPVELKRANIVLNTDIRNIAIQKEGEYRVDVKIDDSIFSQNFFIAKSVNQIN